MNRRTMLLGGAAGLAALGGAALALLGATAAVAAAGDVPGGSVPADAKTAIFATGCFWCTEADFEQVPGVHEAVSGYIGGAVPTPSYEQVAAGGTGHAEAVRVYHDPATVTYERAARRVLAHHRPPGRRRPVLRPRRPVPVGHLPRGRGAGAPRRGVEGGARGQRPVRPADRHRDHPGGPVLPGGGVPPGLLREELLAVQPLPMELRRDQRHEELWAGAES